MYNCNPNQETDMLTHCTWLIKSWSAWVNSAFHTYKCTQRNTNIMLDNWDHDIWETVYETEIEKPEKERHGPGLRTHLNGYK